MPAPSAEMPPMVPELARPGSDPRSVFTPVDPAKAELLLRSFNIYNKWSHVIAGLREGFDVGIKSLPTETILFREPCLIPSQPGLHIFLHGKRTGSRSLLPTLYPIGTRSPNRAISHLSHRTHPKTQFIKIPIDTRSLLPPQPPNHPICQCGHILRRFPHSMGHIRNNCGINPLPAAGLSSSNFRHISSIPTDTCPSRPAERLVPFLGWKSEGRPSSNVRFNLKRRGLRLCRRHAHRHLHYSRVWPFDQMGRRFLRHTPTRMLMDRIRLHRLDGSNWHPMEHGEITASLTHSAVHRLRLEPSDKDGQCSSGKGLSYPGPTSPLGIGDHEGHRARSSEPTWQVGPYLMHLPINSSVPSYIIPFLPQIQIIPSTSPPTRSRHRGFTLDHQHARDTSQRASLNAFRSHRSGLVGRRQHLLWNRRHYQKLLGRLAVGSWSESWPKATIQHRVGRSCSSRVGSSPRNIRRLPVTWALPRAIRQFRGHRCIEQWPFSQPGDERHPEEYIHCFGPAKGPFNSDIRPEPLQCGGCVIQRRRGSLLERLSAGTHPFHSVTSGPPFPAHHTIPITVMPVFGTSITPNYSSQQSPGLHEDSPSLRPNYELRPKCKADERIFLWKGVNTPPPSVINDPVIRMLADLASHESLRDTSGPGSAIKKFHTFCDTFSIPEAQRLPASFEVLHSFALWVVTDPKALDASLVANTRFEPVSIATARKYLSGIRAWHIAQGWPEPLSKEAHKRIEWSLRGLQNIFGSRTRPVRPPITIPMLRALRATLDLSNTFDACIWAMACCAFWGMMRFGEVSVKSRKDFDGAKHLKRSDAFMGYDLDGKRYARLDLPSAKTAAAGEIQSVYVVPQSDLCPIEALTNMAKVTPAGASDPLFSWTDKTGTIRPMVKDKALARINAILQAWGWGTAFGHSFRIGGASFYLAQGKNPEHIRIAGRWKSLAYQVYIRSFELIANRHLGNMPTNFNHPNLEAH